MTPLKRKRESPSDEAVAKRAVYRKLRRPASPTAAMPRRRRPHSRRLPPRVYYRLRRANESSGSLKVFFWILGTLTVGLILAFIVYSALEWDHFHELPSTSGSSQQPGAPSGSEPGGNPDSQVPGQGDPSGSRRPLRRIPTIWGFKLSRCRILGSRPRMRFMSVWSKASLASTRRLPLPMINGADRAGTQASLLPVTDTFTNSHVIYNSRSYAAQVVLHDGST